MIQLDKGKIIGEFDLFDYDLPTQKAYLFHQVSHGGNIGDEYPDNREYLRIIAIGKDNQPIEYGYVYFMLYTTNEGIPVSKYIGSKVLEDYRGKGLGDLLMSIYLYYSYENGFSLIESTTRQRKLDVLSLMNKYGFQVKKPELYDFGERVSIFRNNMVVDVFRQKRGGTYYRFKTTKAELLYRKNNSKFAGGYNYLLSQELDPNPRSYQKIGWIVPNEDYERVRRNDGLIIDNLEKSRFSK